MKVVIVKQGARAHQGLWGGLRAWALNHDEKGVSNRRNFDVSPLIILEHISLKCKNNHSTQMETAHPYDLVANPLKPIGCAAWRRRRIVRVCLAVECQDFDTWEKHHRLLPVNPPLGTSVHNSTLVLPRIHRTGQCSTALRWNETEML